MYYLSGEIDIPFVDALYKDYLENKENPDENNTINIVTIMREGLEPAHPLYKQIEKLLKLFYKLISIKSKAKMLIKFMKTVET